MMMIAAVTGPEIASAQSVRTAGINDLDKNAFLKLLITELRNQDPLSPTDDKEFIAQLAQFSSLEQMQQVNKAMEAFVSNQVAFQAAGLLGRTVSATASDGSAISGKVDSVRFEKGTPILKVGDAEVPLENIMSIS